TPKRGGELLERAAVGWNFRRRIGSVRGLRFVLAVLPIDGHVGGLRLEEDATGFVLPNSEEHEGQSSSGSPEFGVAWNLGLGFPAKELCGDEEREERPDEQRQGLFPEFPHREREESGALQTPDEIRGRKEDSEVLGNFGEKRQGHGGAGKKNQRQPD